MDRRRFMWNGVGTLGAACISPYRDSTAAGREPGAGFEEGSPGTISPDHPNLLVETLNLYGEAAARSIQEQLERRLTLWEMQTGA